MYTLSTNVVGTQTVGREITTLEPDMTTYKKWEDDDHPKNGKPNNTNSSWARVKQVGAPVMFPNYFNWSNKPIQNIYQNYPETIDRTFRSQVIAGDRITFTKQECWSKIDDSLAGAIPVALPIQFGFFIDIPRDEIVTTSTIFEGIRRFLGTFLDNSEDVIGAVRSGFVNPTDVL